jgi:uncharacterized protein YbaP (TraB family)
MSIRRRVSLFIASVLLLLTLAPLAAQDKAANTPALFLLKTDKTVMYFFGSVHVGSADMYPLPAAVLKAFAASANLVVEVNVRDVTPGEVMGLLQKKMSYKSPDSLEKHLSAESLGQLKAILERFGLPYDRFLLFKPVVIDSILTEYGAIDLGYNAKDGIDLYFMDAAAGKKKTILQLESLAEQMDTLSRIPDDAQSLMLSTTLNEFASLKEDLDALTAAWKKGDMDACAKIEDAEFSRSPALEGVRALLLDERNDRMKKRLLEMIAKGGSYFVVIGAGHFAGKNNLIDLIVKEGFSVTRQ